MSFGCFRTHYLLTCHSKLTSQLHLATLQPPQKLPSNLLPGAHIYTHNINETPFNLTFDTLTVYIGTLTSRPMLPISPSHHSPAPTVSIASALTQSSRPSKVPARHGTPSKRGNIPKHTARTHILACGAIQRRCLGESVVGCNTECGELGAGMGEEMEEI